MRWCERQDANSFACTRVKLPSHRFLRDQSCNGLRFETSTGVRCLQYERVRVSERPHARPEATGECGVWCGDRDGDRRYDRCIERLSCPQQEQERSFAGHYAVQHSAVLYETLCAEMPDAVRTKLEAARAGVGDCDEAPLYWVIAPETMQHASDPTGPGLCYGIVEDEGEPTEKEECGEHHCQTLRYCDGREKQQHCTVYAECREGRFVPLRLGW